MDENADPNVQQTATSTAGHQRGGREKLEPTGSAFQHGGMLQHGGMRADMLKVQLMQHQLHTTMNAQWRG